MLARVKNSLQCLLLIVACGVGIQLILLGITIRDGIRMLPVLVKSESGALQAATAAQIEGARDDVRELVYEALSILDRQVSATRASAEIQTGTALSTVDARLGSIQGQIHADVQQLAGKLDPPVAAATDLMRAYQVVPGRLEAALQPSWRSLEPEITCRLPDGAGYGGCMRSRVNGLLGEAFRAGGVFARDFPMLSGSITGIATDAHTFTSRAVAPCRGWCLVRSTLSTGSGVVRAAGAAGVF